MDASHGGKARALQRGIIADAALSGYEQGSLPDIFVTAQGSGFACRFDFSFWHLISSVAGGTAGLSNR
jgi:hypothetical protein